MVLIRPILWAGQGGPKVARGENVAQSLGVIGRGQME